MLVDMTIDNVFDKRLLQVLSPCLNFRTFTQRFTFVDMEHFTSRKKTLCFIYLQELFPESNFIALLALRKETIEIKILIEGLEAITVFVVFIDLTSGCKPGKQTHSIREVLRAQHGYEG